MSSAERPLVRLAMGVAGLLFAAVLLNGCSKIPPNRSPASVVSSVYAFYGPTRPINERFGRFTYVILRSRDQRGATLIEKLLLSTAPASDVNMPYEELNVFAVPSHDTIWTSAFWHDLQNGVIPDGVGKDAVAQFYDLGEADRIRIAACADAPISRRFCKRPSRGPYLITFANAIHRAGSSSMATVPKPYLFVDLGPMETAGFDEIIDAVKAQVQLSDLSDRSRIDTTRLRVLALVLSPSVWIGGYLEGMKGVTELVKGDKDKGS